MLQVIRRRCRCGALIETGKSCPCDPKGANARGYNYQWQQASSRYLDEHPCCAHCGRTVYRGRQRRHPRKGHVDHIKPHQGSRRLFWDEDNWQTLCATCHGVKSRAEGT